MIGRPSCLLGFAAAALALAGADAPEEAIDAAGMMRHIEALASDEFEGRAPGTPGEEKTVDYLVAQLRRIGLKPGNPDGTYVQDVPLVGLRSEVEGTLTVGDRTIALDSTEAWVANSRREAERVTVEGSEVVFVGYGVVAPEYDWDDYKGVDVRGKTLVMLVNDPPVPDPDDPSRLDDATFRGRAMTYYGRWTYKFEIASEKGAAAVLLVHETGPAGYPYEVVVGSWGQEQFDLPTADGNAGRVAVESWIARATAEALFEAAGLDFEAQKRAAARRDFRPVPLGASADLEATNTTRRIASRNVVGLLEGSDPDRRDEVVIYTAHWDHLGRDPGLDGDQVYNGAADNASGVAAVLEVAEAFAQAERPPARSVLFLLVTAEEKGLLGARYYAEHPLYPIARTAAVINQDVVNTWGMTEDLTVVGLGLSTLDDDLAAVADGRALIPDPEPEKGTYYRSDHFEFAKRGVPALNAKGGIRFVGRPEGFGLAKREEYTREDYHKVSDEIKPGWDLSGAEADARLLFAVGRRIADAPRLPEWKAGAEFKAVREAMLGQGEER